MLPLFPFVSFFGGKEWDEIFLNSNYLAGIRHAGINGWLRSTRFGSVLEGKGVCEGVWWGTVGGRVGREGGGWRTLHCAEHREPKTGRILLQLSFLYPSTSHCFTPSPSQMNKTDLALSPHPTPSKSICKNVCFHASRNNIVTCWRLFLPSSLWPVLSHELIFQ